MKYKKGDFIIEQLSDTEYSIFYEGEQLIFKALGEALAFINIQTGEKLPVSIIEF